MTRGDRCTPTPFTDQSPDQSGSQMRKTLCFHLSCITFAAIRSLVSALLRPGKEGKRL